MDNTTGSIIAVIIPIIIAVVFIFFISRRYRNGGMQYQAQMRAQRLAQMGPLGRLVTRIYSVLGVIFILGGAFIFKNNEEARSIGLGIFILVGFIINFFARRLRL